MSGDDYTLYARYHQYGFWSTQRIIYTQWTGRFTSTFLGTLFMKLGLPDRYYFLHALLLLTGTWGATFFLLSAINRSRLANFFPRSKLALASSILLMTSIYVQAETATGFYWFSAAITYQTAFIFFLLLGGCIIYRFNGSGIRRKWIYDGLIGCLILLIIGSNEVAAVFLAFFLLMLTMAAYYYRRTAAIPRLSIYTVFSLLTGVIILFTSGILSVRSQFMNSDTSLAAIVPMILFRWATVFYYLLKVPLFWIAGALLYIIGGRVADHPALGPLLVSWKDKKIVVPGLAAIAILVLLTLAVVLTISKGSLPDRALNNLIDLGAFGLLGLSFMAGLVNRSSGGSGSFRILSPAAFVMILGAGLIACGPFSEACKSTISGYLYYSVQKDRQQKMREAQENRQRTVRLEPYQDALAQKIQQIFPLGTFVSVNSLLRERPTLLFQEHGPDTPEHGWLNYYSLDSITVGQHTP